MKTSHLSSEQQTLLNNWEKYRGAIVMIVGSKIFATKKAAKVPELVKQIEEKFKRRPLITFIPKEGTLILIG
ncbi:TPA: hypothetical protein DIV55_06255 [Patescibacteria group bacterium]|uniref:DUF5678 domain-containing protein n=1 Tax=Candidatus Gottesmanbacteria bacterium GW2011_GWA1_43_11 TaxID=1618436 RepID=A0A0G1CHS0_9BACT|nr:MAG: hypothetical protein UV59_C0008G0043 [Candidatus Gottesmanbacteria bacterium GW2011_GWA1_43_11]HCS79309.1 hypothetical protein [Patescibacteria group bacterium]